MKKDKNNNVCEIFRFKNVVVVKNYFVKMCKKYFKAHIQIKYNSAFKNCCPFLKSLFKIKNKFLFSIAEH